MNIHRTLALGATVLLAACATLPPDDARDAVQALAAGRTGGVDASLAASDSDARATTRALLAQPLTADAAVRIALINNPQLQSSIAALGISDAERVQASRPLNPHLALGAFSEGNRREIERFISFDVLGLITLPWRAQWAGQQSQLARLQAAQDVVRIAAGTRKAWIEAVASAQTLAYLRDAHEAAQAGAELAQRMVRAGNWSRLQAARESSLLAEVSAQLARAQLATLASREQLTRLMGLDSPDAAAFMLAERLPDVPRAPRDLQDVETTALARRLDVRAAQDESRYIAASLGYTRTTGVINALELGVRRDTVFDNTAGTRGHKRGVELDVPLPLFDWGQGRTARAQAIYLQSAAKVREVAVQARSEARETHARYITAHALARRYSDEIVPLRRTISEETALRYNGMLASPWELLAEARATVMAVNAGIQAQRDFWLADTDLDTALTGTSPGGLAALRRAGTQDPTQDPTNAQGH